MPMGISYTLKLSSRSRRLSIAVNTHGDVIVTAPRFVPKYKISEFVESARSWIEKQREVQQKKPSLISATHCLYFGKDYSVKVSKRMDGTVKVGKEVIIAAPLVTSHQSLVALISSWLKARSVEYVTKRVYELSEQMNLPFNGLAFKQQKTRWGSCSSKKNLNFNWKLIHAPTEVIDYVIIHELSHTKEMNHGKRFWDLVSSYDPDHALHRRWLQRYGSTED